MAHVALEIGGDVAEAVQEIKDGHTQNSWVIIDYLPKSNRLRVQAKGEGGIAEFNEELNDGKIQYGYLRFQMQQTAKFLYVSFCGGGVEGMRKGLFNNHAKEMERWLSEAGRGFHIQINAREEDDLKESIVLEKLNKATNAFLRTNNLKGTDKGELKDQSNQYWLQQKNKEAEHKQAVSAHEQEKQNRLATSKQVEQQRLEQQAKQSLSEMERQRQQESAAFRASEEERTAAQVKAREANNQRVLADVQQRKAASAISADASHGVRQSAPPPVSRPSFNQSATEAPKPAPAVKKAPGKLNAPSAFNQPAAAPVQKPAPSAAKKWAPPKAAAPAPAPSKPSFAAPSKPSFAAPSKPAPPPSKPAPPRPRVPEPEPEPVYEEPAYEEPAYEEPAYEEPAYQEPAYEEPAYEEPAYQEPAYEEPAYEEPAYQEPAYEEPAYQEPAYEEQQAYDQGGESQSYGSQARALYDYGAEAETDLSFAEGEIINILDDTDPSGWWKGELNGVEGFFPSNFVEKI